MYIEGGTGNARDDRFVMAARKLVTKTTSYYLISTEMDPSDRGSMYLLGRLRANAVGSQYLITDHGLAPDKTASDNLIRKVKVANPCDLKLLFVMYYHTEWLGILIVSLKYALGAGRLGVPVR
jgi:hypothetical protein